MVKLLKTHKLTFSIPALGQYNSDMNYVEGATVNSVIEGSLQGMGKSIKTDKLPYGFLSSDIRVFYSKTNIPIRSEYTGGNSATTIIGGVPFIVWDKEENIGFNLEVDHYKIFLVNKARANGEGWK